MHRRRRRNPQGFDPIPWVIGAAISYGVYQLFELITSGSGATAAGAGSNGPALPPGATETIVPGAGGGTSW